MIVAPWVWLVIVEPDYHSVVVVLAHAESDAAAVALGGVAVEPALIPDPERGVPYYR